MNIYFPLSNQYKLVKEYGNLSYSLGKDGAMKTGWFRTPDGYWYYCDTSCKRQLNTTIDRKYKLDYQGRGIVLEKILIFIFYRYMKALQVL